MRSRSESCMALLAPARLDGMLELKRIRRQLGAVHLIDRASANLGRLYITLVHAHPTDHALGPLEDRWCRNHRGDWLRSGQFGQFEKYCPWQQQTRRKEQAHVS